jgi:hypothetical protein
MDLAGIVKFAFLYETVNEAIKLRREIDILCWHKLKNIWLAMFVNSIYRFSSEPSQDGALLPLILSFAVYARTAGTPIPAVWFLPTGESYEQPRLSPQLRHL